MPIPLFLVDAFAELPLQGNPAAVCILEKLPEGLDNPDAWFQRVAGEMNQAETAFVQPSRDGWDLRWFTPVKEVDLCGHATLASAHALWQTKRQKPDDAIAFATRSGTLTCKQTAHGISMDFPSEPATACSSPPELIAGLGVPARFVGRNRMDYVVLLDSEKTVRTLTPNFEMLSRVSTRGIIITAEGSGGYDFVSRSFFPLLGVPEDHVCGSAHCCLAPFWRERLGKTEMAGYQASKRGGVVHVRCEDARVILSGRAVTTMRGELIV